MPVLQPGAGASTGHFVWLQRQRHGAWSLINQGTASSPSVWTDGVRPSTVPRKHRWRSHVFQPTTPATGDQTVSLTGLDTAASFGALTILPGNVNVSPGSLTSAAAFGTITAIPGNVLIPLTGLGSAAGFGAITAVGGSPPVSTGSIRRWRYRRSSF